MKNKFNSKFQKQRYSTVNSKIRMTSAEQKIHFVCRILEVGKHQKRATRGRGAQSASCSPLYHVIEHGRVGAKTRMKFSKTQDGVSKGRQRSRVGRRSRNRHAHSMKSPSRGLFSAQTSQMQSQRSRSKDFGRAGSTLPIDREFEPTLAIFSPNEQLALEEEDKNWQNEKVVIVAENEGTKTQSEFTQQLRSREDLSQYVHKYKGTKVYKFDQVQNDNHSPLQQKLTPGITSTNKGLDSKPTRFFRDSIIREKLFETLNSGLQQCAQDMQSPVNFCYIQLNASPADPQELNIMNLSKSKYDMTGKSKEVDNVPNFGKNPNSECRRKAKNFGSFLSLKAVDNEVNVAYLALKDIINYQKELATRVNLGKSQASGSANKKALRRPQVKVSVMMLYNAEIFDLLNEQRQRGKIRFEQVQNEMIGSANYGQQYKTLKGLSKIEVNSIEELNLIIKIAQQTKQWYSERLNYDLEELTRRSATVVRVEIADRRAERVKLLDFVEMPATSVLLEKGTHSVKPAKQNDQNQTFVLDLYNSLSSSLVLLQSFGPNSILDQKKEQKLKMSVLTQMLKETLFLSFPCQAVLNCPVMPESQHRLSSLTALKYTSQIREHVMKKVSQTAMNKDLIGQSIETIDNELNLMQIKLEQGFASTSRRTSQQDKAEEPIGALDGAGSSKADLHKNETFGEQDKEKIAENEQLYQKLKELIQIYKLRVQEFRQEHKIINIQKPNLNQALKTKRLQEEVEKIREELAEIQKDLGIQPQALHFDLGEQIDEQERLLKQLEAIPQKEHSAYFSQTLTSPAYASKGIASSLNQSRNDFALRCRSTHNENKLDDEPDLLIQQEHIRPIQSGHVQFLDESQRAASNPEHLYSLKTEQQAASPIDHHIAFSQLLNSQQYVPVRCNKSAKPRTTSEGNCSVIDNYTDEQYKLGPEASRVLSSINDSHSISSGQRYAPSKPTRTRRVKARKSSKTSHSLNASIRSRGTSTFHSQHSRSRSKSNLQNQTISSAKKQNTKFKKKGAQNVTKSRNKSQISKKSTMKQSKKSQMKKRHGKNCSQERSINQDLEESPPSYGKIAEFCLEDGGFKGNKKVDFYLEPTPEQKSPEVANGTANADGGGVVEDFMNPYTDNLYININVNNSGEVMEELRQQQAEHMTSAGDGAATNKEQQAPQSHLADEGQNQSMASASSSRLQQKAHQLLHKYRQAKKGGTESQNKASHNSTSAVCSPQSQPSSAALPKSTRSSRLELHAESKVSESILLANLKKVLAFKENEIQMLHENLKKAEELNEQNQNELKDDLHEIRKIMVRADIDKAAPIQKLAELMNFKITAKEQMIDLMFKLEREQRISRQKTEENQQLLAMLKKFESSLISKEQKIESLEVELDMSAVTAAAQGNPTKRTPKKTSSQTMVDGSKRNAKKKTSLSKTSQRHSRNSSQLSEKSRTSSLKKSSTSKNAHSRSRHGTIEIGKTTLKEYRETIDYMEQEIVRLQDTSPQDDLKAKSTQMEDEILLLRKQTSQLSSQKAELTLELQHSRIEESKVPKLQAYLAKVQSQYRLKCHELQELAASLATLEANAKEMEEGRDNWRSQYLEIREINKDVEQKAKALQKQLNAQVRIGKENINSNENNELQTHEQLLKKVLQDRSCNQQRMAQTGMRQSHDK